MLEQLDVLRRIAERGKSLCERRAVAETDAGYLDIFVHLLDEIKRTKDFYETYEEIE